MRAVLLAGCTFRIGGAAFDASADLATPDLAMADLTAAPDLSRPPCPAVPSLVACYPFEDASGAPIADRSMYGNAAVATRRAHTDRLAHAARCGLLRLSGNEERDRLRFRCHGRLAYPASDR